MENLKNNAEEKGFKRMKVEKVIKKLKSEEHLEIISGASSLKTGHVYVKKMDIVDIDLYQDFEGNIRTLFGHKLVMTKDEYESVGKAHKTFTKRYECDYYPFIVRNPADNWSEFKPKKRTTRIDTDGDLRIRMDQDYDGISSYEKQLKL